MSDNFNIYILVFLIYSIVATYTIYFSLIHIFYIGLYTYYFFFVFTDFNQYGLLRANSPW